MQGFQCGMQTDTCGTTIDCGMCPSGQFCVSGGKCMQLCQPETCAQQGFNCGAATDTCGMVINCGMCPVGQSCGAGGANKCGSGSGPACMAGQLCMQQTTCPGNATTSITGTVFAPNTVDPLPNTLVYVPNLGLAGLSHWTDGVVPSHCSCSADVQGDPLVNGVTDYKGNFTITNMPVGNNIPLVLQNGRWRRVVTIPNVPSCTSTNVNAVTSQAAMSMPNKQGETSPFDNIPKMGFVTGTLDALECALRKLGITDSEFTNPGNGGRVEMYKGAGGPGATIDATTPSETSLWTTQATINGYDMVYFACQGHQSDNPAAAQTNVVNYANAGGRVFATHYSYTWLYDVNPWMQTAEWYCTTPGCNPEQLGSFTSDPQIGYIDTSFPAGNTLAEWLFYIKASTTMGQMRIQTLRDDFKLVNPPTQRWVYLKDKGYTYDKTMHFTFDTPWQAAPTSLCGKVLYSDFHVEDSVTIGDTFPQECMQTCLDSVTFGACKPADGCTCSANANACKTDADCNVFTPQEKMLEFFLFDLGGCVQPPTCTPASCAGQNVQCGPAPDGCGNIIMCGSCPSGQSCIAGKCQQVCQPESCAAQHFICGNQGDGCGNIQNCGSCPAGMSCSNGVCTMGGCQPKSCAAQGLTCGMTGDTCGNILNCGNCLAGEICGGGGKPGQCYKPPCTPTTCVAQGYNCGETPDGCNSCTMTADCPTGETCVQGTCVLNCGMCTGNQICGGGGTPNVCGGGAN
jgi:hypothetical protein